MERITAERFEDSPARAGMTPEMTAAFVGATIEDRACLHRGEEGSLPDLIPQLMELILAYTPPPQPLRLGRRLPTHPVEAIEDARDHGERALRAFAAVAAERGYAQTTINEVVKRAAMSPTTFYSNFGGKEDAPTAAIDGAGARIAAEVLPAFRRGADWARGVRAAFGALFDFLCLPSAAPRLVLVEVYAAGPDAVPAYRNQAALRPLAEILAELADDGEPGLGARPRGDRRVLLDPRP